MVILRDENKVDNRHTVDRINSLSFADAVQINPDGTYEHITYMDDDQRTWGNEAIIDATDKEKEAYRKYCKIFQKGDKVKIVKGKKMLGETKEVKDKFTYIVPNTYGKKKIYYLVFTDNTKVNEFYCEFA